MENELLNDFMIVFVTAGSKDEAERLARRLVEEKLAACINVISDCSSTYLWKGKVEKAQESLLLIKTRKALFNKLSTRVLELHTYEVPEIIAVSLAKASDTYYQYLKETLGDS